MEIKTKYEIGQRIWVVYIHEGEVHVFDDSINEIYISSNEIEYWGKLGSEPIEEKEVIKYEDKIGLANRIKELLEESEGEDE